MGISCVPAATRNRRRRSARVVFGHLRHSPGGGLRPWLRASSFPSPCRENLVGLTYVA